MKTKEEFSKNEHFNTLDKSLIWSISASDDSLNTVSTVIIWPTGKFSFSPLEGFSGMAERVLISGTQKTRRQVLEEKIERKEQAKDSSVMAAGLKSIEKGQQLTIKEKFPIFTWWLFLWIILCGLGLSWLWRNYKGR